MFKWLTGKRCKHEYMIGEPDSLYQGDHPAVCRWCSDRRLMSAKEAFHWKEWQRLEKERAAWPAGEKAAIGGGE
jgi:hypothetical protein